MKKKKSLPKRLAARVKKSVLTKTQSSLKCAWCGKPATTFLAQHPHCGGSHPRTAVDVDILAIEYDRLRRVAWKVVHANEAMHVTGEVIPVAEACEKLKAVLKRVIKKS